MSRFGVITRNGIVRSFIEGSQAIIYDADAVAFFTAASITDTTQKSAVNQLVLDLKAASIWAKMKALYPVVGGVASSHAVNLKTPGTYNLSFATGWTHASTGMTPNGATYANTNLIPYDTFNNTTFNHLAYYSRTNSAIAFEYVMGSSTSNGSNSMIIRRDNNLGYGFADYSSGTSYRGASGSVTNSLGLFTFSQTGNAKLFKNNTIIASNTYTSINVSLSNFTIVLGADNNIGIPKNYTNKECAFASIGDGLTDAEALSFYNAVQTFQTTLGRQV